MCLNMQCIFICTNISEKYFCFESLSLLHQQLGCLDQEPHVISAAKGWQLPRADTAWHSGTHSWDQSGTQLLEKKQANNVCLTTIFNVDILYPFLVKQWFLSVFCGHDNRTWSTMVQRVMGMIPTVFTKITSSTQLWNIRIPQWTLDWYGVPRMLAYTQLASNLSLSIPILNHLLIKSFIL